MKCKDYILKYKENLIGINFFYNLNNIPEFDNNFTQQFYFSKKGYINPLLKDFELIDKEILESIPLKVLLLSYEDYIKIYNNNCEFENYPFSPEKYFLLFLINNSYCNQDRF